MARKNWAEHRGNQRTERMKQVLAKMDDLQLGEAAIFPSSYRATILAAIRNHCISKGVFAPRRFTSVYRGNQIAEVQEVFVLRIL